MVINRLSRCTCMGYTETYDIHARYEGTLAYDEAQAVELSWCTDLHNRNGVYGHMLLYLQHTYICRYTYICKWVIRPCYWQLFNLLHTFAEGLYETMGSQFAEG